MTVDAIRRENQHREALATFDFSFLSENPCGAGTDDPIRSSRPAQSVYELPPVRGVLDGEENEGEAVSPLEIRGKLRDRWAGDRDTRLGAPRL